jgi:hypothetical protein
MTTRFAAYYADVPQADLAAIRRRAERRVRTRRTVAIGASLTVIGATVTSISMLGDTGRVEVEGPADVAPTESDLVWTVADGAEMTFPKVAVVGPDGTSFAVSSAPAASAPGGWTGSLFRSSDGLVWEQMRVTDDGLAIADLAVEPSGRIVAVGTSVAGAAVIGTSGDDGATFETIDLPVDVRAMTWRGVLPAIEADVATSGSTTTAAVQVTLGSDGIGLLPPDAEVAVLPQVTHEGVQTFRAVDDPAGLSAQVCGEGTLRLATSGDESFATTTTAPPGPAPTGAGEVAYVCSASGINRSVSPAEVPGAPGRLYTWAELGAPAAAVGALQADIIVFRSIDGHPFEQVATVDGHLGDMIELISTGDGFAMSVTDLAETPQATVYSSPDALTWTPAATAPGGVVFAQHTGRVGDRLLVAGQERFDSDDLNVVATSVDGVIWDTVSIAELVDSGAPTNVDGWATGPMGAAALVSTAEATPRLFMVTSPDGVQWSVTSLDEIAGQQIGPMRTQGAPVVGADFVSVTVQQVADGSEPVTLVARYA